MASGVRITWMITAAIFLGIGLGLVWWPASQTIAAVKEQAKSLYDEANQNEADVQRAEQLRAVAKRVSDDVRQLSGQASSSAVTAATLTLLNRESRVHAIDIRSIVPAPVASASAAPAAARPADSALLGTAIEIDVRGGFRDVLAFISDLPRHNVLIDVNDINLVDRGDHSSKPALGVTIHATVFRYKGIIEGEIRHASGAL
ncbi:MAG: type 4a pilus biogenesis protein PilO [Candidatus Aquilonibacter sp.]